MAFFKKAKEKQQKKEKEEIILQIESELAQKYTSCVYRDTIKDKPYMLHRAAHTVYDIRILERDIEQEPSELTSPAVKRSPNFLGKNLTRKDRLYDILFLTKADLLNNLYSIGADVATLVPIVEELITLSRDCWDGAGTGAMDWLIPAAVLFGVDQASFGILSQLWFSEKPKMHPNSKGDFVLEFYFQAYTNDASLDYQARPVLFPQQRNRLAELIKTGPEAGEDTVKTYLEKHWFKANQEYTLDTYRNLTIHDNLLYNGFWAYDVGAIVKILGINDAGLRDTVFYPYDAVHFQCFRRE